MNKSEKANIAASIRGRLLTLSRERNEDYNLVLTRYAMERFLHRLSLSPHREELILKGAMLFQIWSAAPHRSTRDLDLLATGNTKVEDLTAKLSAICNLEVDEDDGVTFDLTGLNVIEIREETRYGGIRAKFRARLNSAQIPIQIDFGVGDAVTPEPIETGYPTLLDMAKPIIMAYPRETVIAEKLEAIVELGMENSRMKDYFDLWFIATTFRDDSDQTALAIRRTFERRAQPLPRGIPVGLSEEFVRSATKQAQWKAFIGRTVETTLSLDEVVSCIRQFVMPKIEALDT